MMKWIDTNHCKLKLHCLACRNDERWRQGVVDRFGEFECPYGIPIGTPLEELPQETHDHIERLKRENRARQEHMAELRQCFDRLEKVVPAESMPDLQMVYDSIFPPKIVCRWGKYREDKRTECQHEKAKGTVRQSCRCIPELCNFYEAMEVRE